MNDVPTTYKIAEVRRETPTVMTFRFDAPEISSGARPGNFLMAWIPRVDEVPISISCLEPLELTVKRVGEATHALHTKKKGDYIGLRGPYGNSFQLKGKRVLIVGGGAGIAPLRALALSTSKEYTAILGAQTKGELFALDDFEEPLLCTDDGTMGKKAFTTQLAEHELKRKAYSMVVGCGPEVMLKHLFTLANKHKKPVQFSMERWMKCGLGICGHCAVEPTGWRVCKDGPIADTEVLKAGKEFFSFKRDQVGKEVEI